jgi:sugar phosphate isomerase/epimerase
MLAHLQHVIRLSGVMGVRALTFGSPKNRDRTGVPEAEARMTAASFFRELGSTATEANVLFCLEPNPAAYGCNFMTTTLEAADIVRVVDHPNVRLQLDTGTVIANGEDYAAIVPAVADIVGHVHASEPNLPTLGGHAPEIREILGRLDQAGVARPFTIEMLASKSMPHAGEITRAVEALQGR